MRYMALFFITLFLYILGVYVFFDGLPNFYSGSGGSDDKMIAGLVIFGTGFITNFVSIYIGSKKKPVSLWWHANVFLFFVVLITGLLIFIRGFIRSF